MASFPGSLPLLRKEYGCIEVGPDRRAISLCVPVRIQERLFVVTPLFGWIGNYFAEEPVVLIVWTGGKVELNGGTGRAITSETQSPQAIHGQRLAARVE